MIQCAVDRCRGFRKDIDGVAIEVPDLEMVGERKFTGTSRGAVAIFGGARTFDEGRTLFGTECGVGGICVVPAVIHGGAERSGDEGDGQEHC